MCKVSLVVKYMWKQEDQAFLLHTIWTRVAIFWCRDKDIVYQGLDSSIIEQYSTWKS